MKLRYTKSELANLEDGLHWTGYPCLHLQVTGEGDKRTRSWIYRYYRAGRRHDLGLGSFEEIDIRRALILAGDARVLLLKGIDPIEDRRAKVSADKAKRAADITFAEAMGQYIEFHEAKWRDGGSARQWRSSLTRFAFPVIGNLSLSDIETAHIQRVLRPIWLKIPVTASRVRNRIEAILNWGTANGYRKGENPARWEGHLSELFPSPKKVAKVRHHAALSYDEVPALVRQLAASDSITSRALEFTILTACRSGEVLQAKWEEVALAKKLWVIPEGRTKAGREHRVPLSRRAVDLLNSLPRVNDYVFPGSKPNKPINRSAMIGALEGKTTVHGFRSAFRDWCGDRTNFPRDVAEAALDHKLRDATEVAYRRGDALEKRRRLMEEWSKFLSSKEVAGGEVVALHG
jgi:integrase